MRKEFLVTKEQKGERLDKFLAETLNCISRNRLKCLIEEGRILVNGREKKVSYHLKPDDHILVEYEKRKDSGLIPLNLEIEIIYENKDIFIVNKPSGITTHPPQPGYNDTLVNALKFMNKELSTLNPLRPGLVHRLDKETSGLMVLAKNNEAHLNLVEQFKQRLVKKEYRAIVRGLMKQDKFDISLPLKRDKANRLKMKVGFTKSKEAYTSIEVLERFRKSCLLSIKPSTGRTHQIRVHMSFLGYPIVGDKKYGIKDNYPSLLLHACKLGFYHPSAKNFLEFNSPLPERFEKFIREQTF